MANGRYRLSTNRIADLDGIADYLIVRNRQASRRVVEALSNAFAALAQNPELGERRDNVAPGLRVFSPRRPAHSYVILYYDTDDGVEISAVTHGARDWPSLFTSGDR